MYLRATIGLLVGASFGFILGMITSCASGSCLLAGSPWVSAVIFALLGWLIMLMTTPRTASEETSERSSAPVIHVSTQTQLETHLAGASPVLVEFTTAWCGPCRRMAPVMEELAHDLDGRAVVTRVDVDQAPEIAERYGVASVPTVLIFRNGRIASTLRGFHGKDDLLAAVVFAP